jgi:release factor glutamine methyltransferase
MLRRLIKLFLYAAVRPVALWYLRSERRFRFEGLDLVVKPGVFHPGLFFTTKFLIEALREVEIRGEKLLEMGAGSGLISLWCARRGAIVTAADISPTAVATIEDNIRANLAQLAAGGGPPRVILSDMFDQLPREPFDFVVINPPFYPRNPRTLAEKAWFCGKNFEYFEKLFGQIGDYLQPGTRVLMTLSEDCDIPRIREIARRNGLALGLEKRKRFFVEDEFIFSLRPVLEPRRS